LRAEEEIRALKAHSAEELSTAKTNRGELWKQMMQRKAQADEERKGLVDKLDDANNALEAANSRCEAEKGRANMLEHEKDKIKKKVLARVSWSYSASSHPVSLKVQLVVSFQLV
jgi:hypothetical protein